MEQWQAHPTTNFSVLRFSALPFCFNLNLFFLFNYSDYNSPDLFICIYWCIVFVGVQKFVSLRNRMFI
jgi:hypothetical protein